jgi:ribosome recycling factor
VRGKKKKAKGKDKGAASAASAAADDDDASDASDDVSDDASDDAPAVEFDKAVVSALMDAAVEALERDLGKLRTGRASPGMLESLVVDAYGEPTPLRNLGSVTARNAQTLAVMLYDPTLKGAVQNAITESPLGFNPQEDGDGTLLVPVPEMTHETKVQVAKLCHRAGETAKISVRNAEERDGRHQESDDDRGRGESRGEGRAEDERGVREEDRGARVGERKGDSEMMKNARAFCLRGKERRTRATRDAFAKHRRR